MARKTGELDLPFTGSSTLECQTCTLPRQDRRADPDQEDIGVLAARKESTRKFILPLFCNEVAWVQR